MGTLRYAMLNDDWKIVDESSFVSPINDREPEQTLIFSDRIKNGSISADITPLDASKRQSGEVRYEAEFVFRYNGPEGYYYAGTGAWGTKFFLGIAQKGPFYT